MFRAAEMPAADLLQRQDHLFQAGHYLVLIARIKPAQTGLDHFLGQKCAKIGNTLRGYVGPDKPACKTFQDPGISKDRTGGEGAFIRLIKEAHLAGRFLEARQVGGEA